MLKKYFKRQKSRRGDSEDSGGGDDVVDSTPSKRHSLRSTTSFCDELLEEWCTTSTTSLASSLACGAEAEDAAERRSVGGLSFCGALSIGAGVGADEDIFKYRSRLSMTLPAIVNDGNCLSFFVQYLDAKHALPLIKFYLDTENFRRAAFQQLERRRSVSSKVGHSSDAKEYCGAAERRPKEDADDINPIAVKEEEKGEEDEEEENTVPEMKSLCDLSMRKPLTDDEKSQIYAETNKQITKCNNNNFSNNINSWPDAGEGELPECLNQDGAPEISAASVKDAIAIYKKYLIADAQQFVQLPVAILSQISLLLCKRDDDDDADSGQSDVATASPISPCCFDEAQRHVLEVLEHDHVDDYLQSSYYCQYCVELIEGAPNGESLTIYDVLYSEVTLFFFMEFLEQHGERSCLDFWSTAIYFRKSYALPPEEEPEEATTSAASTTQSQSQSDAMIIYEKFFSLQSESRLWLSDKLRCHVEERICALDGCIAACFDVPLQVVAQYLAQKYLAEFLASQLFENYVNELRAKVHEERGLSSLCGGAAKLSLRRSSSSNHSNGRPVGRHRKTLSDCGSDSEGIAGHRHSQPSISQQNTLLAMADNYGASHLRQLQTAASSLQIDARQLTHPQMLWQRSTSVDGGVAGGGLKFGRINALGRYERDFEAVDMLGGTAGGKLSGQWSFGVSSARLKNAMRKLVNLPEDKVQEEIAWQVAEMIVNDVTSVTQPTVRRESATLSGNGLANP